MSSTTTIPLDPDSPRGIAAAARIGEVLGRILVNIAERKAAEAHAAAQVETTPTSSEVAA
jgi:hypothetical protein